MQHGESLQDMNLLFTPQTMDVKLSIVLGEVLVLTTNSDKILSIMQLLIVVLWLLLPLETPMLYYLSIQRLTIMFLALPPPIFLMKKPIFLHMITLLIFRLPEKQYTLVWGLPLVNLMEHHFPLLLLLELRH